MNIQALTRLVRPALIVLGGAVMVLGLLLVWSGVTTRQAVESAQQAAVEHAAELAAELQAIQVAMDSATVQRAAIRQVADGWLGDEALLDAVRAAGIDQPRSVQVFGTVLEDIELGEYPQPDFTILEMLLEARRTGSAVPEVHAPAGRTPYLALARRLENDGMMQGILLLHLPVDALVSRVERPNELDYLALSQGRGQGRTELWQQGQRPAREPARQAVANSRLWLEWHHVTSVPATGLRAAGFTVLFGFVLLLIAMRGSDLEPQIAALKTKFSTLGRSHRRRTAARGGSITAGSPGLAEPHPRPDGLSLSDGLDWNMDDSPAARHQPAGALSLEEEPSARLEEDQGLASDDSDAEGNIEESLPFPGEEASESGPQAAEEPGLALAQEDSLDEPMADAPLPGDRPEEPSAYEAAAAEPESPAPPAKPSKGSEVRTSGRPSPVDSRLFTDAGILGRFEAGLDARSATLIGQALGDLAGERGVDRMVVGRDARLHGPILMAGLINGLRSSGIDVLDIGAGAAPVLDYAIRESAGMCGVLVTGSHLPADWNGFRVTLGGKLLSGSDVHALQARIADGAGGGGAGELTEQAFSGRYVEAVSARIQLERPLKVVVDCANGASGLIVPRLLAAIGADAIPLYADVDGSFPSHLPDPSRLENLEDVRLCVRNFRADLGFAIGGDGDRLVMLGPRGEVYWPDRFLTVLVRDLLEREPGATVVQDAMCSPRLGRFVESLGGRWVVTDLGPAAVQAALLEHDAVLGVTFAGQVFEGGNWSTGGDALFAICRLLEILAADTRDVPDLLAEVPDWFSQPPLFLPTRPSTPEKVLDRLLESADVSGAEVGNDHGFSIDYGNAWTRICRSADGSGLIVRFEGDDEAAVTRLTELVRHLLLLVDERLKLPF